MAVHQQLLLACLSWLYQKSATWLLHTNQSRFLRPNWCMMSSKKRISQEVPSFLQKNVLQKVKVQDTSTYELNGRTTTNSSYVQYMLSLSETEHRVSRQRPKFPQGLVAWLWLVHVRRQKPWEGSIRPRVLAIGVVIRGGQWSLQHSTSFLKSISCEWLTGSSSLDHECSDQGGKFLVRQSQILYEVRATPQPMQKWNGMFLLCDSELICGGVRLNVCRPGQAAMG